MAITIAQETPNNSEESYTLPADFRKLSFWTAAADVNFRGTTTGGTNFLMDADQLYVLEDRNFAGETFYWQSGSSVTVYLMIETGLGS